MTSIKTIDERQAVHPRDVRGYDTDALRGDFLIERVFVPGEITLTYSHYDRMIVGGMSNKEIAFALDVSENTVKSHVSNIFDKMGVSDRTTAATTAIKRGLVRVDI